MSCVSKFQGERNQCLRPQSDRDRIVRNVNRRQETDKLIETAIFVVTFVNNYSISWKIYLLDLLFLCYFEDSYYAT